MWGLVACIILLACLVNMHDVEVERKKEKVGLLITRPVTSNVMRSFSNRIAGHNILHRLVVIHYNNVPEHERRFAEAAVAKAMTDCDLVIALDDSSDMQRFLERLPKERAGRAVPVNSAPTAIRLFGLDWRSVTQLNGSRDVAQMVTCRPIKRLRPFSPSNHDVVHAVSA